MINCNLKGIFSKRIAPNLRFKKVCCRINSVLSYTYYSRFLKKNLTLLVLASLIDKNVDTGDAVQRTLAGEKAGKPGSKPKPVENNNRKGKENNVPARGGVNNRSRSNSRDNKVNGGSSRESTAGGNRSLRGSRESTANNRSRGSTADSNKSRGSGGSGGEPAVDHNNMDSIPENENGADSGLGTVEEDPGGEVKGDGSMEHGVNELDNQIEDPRPEVDMMNDQEAGIPGSRSARPRSSARPKSSARARPDSSMRPAVAGNDTDEGLGQETSGNLSNSLLFASLDT